MSNHSRTVKNAADFNAIVGEAKAAGNLAKAAVVVDVVDEAVAAEAAAAATDRSSTLARC